jgi:peptidoglycan/LPS O-acetylase OafA/YrhL
LAAVFVLLHHAFIWLHPGYINGYLKHPDRYGRVSHTLFFVFYIFRFGHVAVILFFVLSGFVIHLRYARRAALGQPNRLSDWPRFLFRRAKRLYPPLLLAILVTFVADHLGATLGYSVYFARTPYPVVNQSIGNNHSIVTLVGNLSFLMETYVPIWGTDGPLWSLKFEWWFYAIYPITWLLMRRSHWPATAMIIGMFALSPLPRALPFALILDVSSKMIIWWLGALLAEAYVGRLGLTFRQLAVLVLILPTATALCVCGHEPPEIIWGIGFVGLIALGFAFQERGRTIRPLEKLKWLGDCSYTLYVIHAPLMVFASGLLMSRSPLGELPDSFLPALLISCAMVPLAYLLHLGVETPFARQSRRGINEPEKVRSTAALAVSAAG